MEDNEIIELYWNRSQQACCERFQYSSIISLSSMGLSSFVRGYNASYLYRGILIALVALL